MLGTIKEWVLDLVHGSAFALTNLSAKTTERFAESDFLKIALPALEEWFVHPSLKWATFPQKNLISQRLPTMMKSKTRSLAALARIE
mmetsp:Transcript_6082/g.11894  ORF Transcript_6082/g.11894 Transcript_6082/m.11894 type:complete len:87 (+) Transcript_6082:662-922(+)